jgi:hypothetical protein
MANCEQPPSNTLESTSPLEAKSELRTAKSELRMAKSELQKAI